MKYTVENIITKHPVKHLFFWGHQPNKDGSIGKNRFEIIRTANFYKFSQNPELTNFLCKTNNRILVEASPVDPIWGIGLPAVHADAQKPKC